MAEIDKNDLEKAHSGAGMGERDQDFGDPKPDPNLAGPDGVPDGMSNKPGHDRGAVAGADGNQPPLEDIKPGTKVDIEQKL